MTDKTERTATCCCEQLSIAVVGIPVFYGICHCDNCKKRTGTAFGMSAYFENTQIVEIRGASYVYEIHGSKKQSRSFCSECGTTLFWKLASQPDWTGIAAACFTDNPLPDPDLSVSTEGKFEWLTLPEEWETSA